MKWQIRARRDKALINAVRLLLGLRLIDSKGRAGPGEDCYAIAKKIADALPWLDRKTFELAKVYAEEIAA
jgi:hypothetical protein